MNQSEMDLFKKNSKEICTTFPLPQNSKEHIGSLLPGYLQNKL